MTESIQSTIKLDQLPSPSCLVKDCSCNVGRLSMCKCGHPGGHFLFPEELSKFSTDSELLSICERTFKTMSHYDKSQRWTQLNFFLSPQSEQPHPMYSKIVIRVLFFSLFEDHSKFTVGEKVSTLNHINDLLSANDPTGVCREEAVVNWKKIFWKVVGEDVEDDLVKAALCKIFLAVPSFYEDQKEHINDLIESELKKERRFMCSDSDGLVLCFLVLIFSKFSVDDAFEKVFYSRRLQPILARWAGSIVHVQRYTTNSYPDAIETLNYVCSDTPLCERYEDFLSLYRQSQDVISSATGSYLI